MRGMEEDVHPLRAFRKRENLSQEQLAGLLGVDRATVNRWERGHRKPDLDMLPLIQERTGISPREIRPDIATLIGSAA